MSNGPSISVVVAIWTAIGLCAALIVLSIPDGPFTGLFVQLFARLHERRAAKQSHRAQQVAESLSALRVQLPDSYDESRPHVCKFCLQTSCPEFCPSLGAQFGPMWQEGYLDRCHGLMERSADPSYRIGWETTDKYMPSSEVSHERQLA